MTHHVLLSMWEACPPGPAALATQAVRGWHLVIDADGIQADLQEEELARWLTQWAETLGLTVVSPPSSWSDPSQGIVAAIVLLSESHASLHFGRKERTVHADLYSCRPFDASLAVGWLKERLGAARCRHELVERTVG